MKNSSENKSFAVFIILSFLVYIMSNGEWCIPIFAWIYPILFLCMIYLNRTRKIYLIICFIYAIGFVVRDDLVYRNKNIHELKRIDT